MKLRDFELGNIDLVIGEEIYDLHNNFDFRGFCYDVAARELTLRWTRGVGEWIPKNSPSEIVLTVCLVSHLSCSPRDAEMPYTEDDCLNCVSFVEPNQATDKSFIVSGPADTDLHYVFQFMSGFTLRVQADEAVCQVS